MSLSDIANKWELLPPNVRNQLDLMSQHLSEFAMTLNHSSFQRYSDQCEIKKDGDKWCVILGGFPEGVVGFGDTPKQAINAFDKAMQDESGHYTLPEDDDDE